MKEQNCIYSTAYSTTKISYRLPRLKLQDKTKTDSETKTPIFALDTDLETKDHGLEITPCPSTWSGGAL